MTAKEYLNQAYIIDRRISIDDAKLNAMRAALHGRGVNYESDGSQHIPQGNSIEAAIIKVIEYEERVNAEIDELVDKKREIEKVINRIENVQLREIIIRRYLQFQKWEKIAVDMNTDLRWIYRLHKKALGEVDKIIDH